MGKRGRGGTSRSTHEAAKRWVRRRWSFPATAMAGDLERVLATAMVDGEGGGGACLNISAASSSMAHPVGRRRNAARVEAMERRYDA